MTLKAEKPRAKAKKEDKRSTPVVAASREGRTPSATGIVDRMQAFIRESRSELRKVTWPTREQAMNLTFVVLATSAAVGLFLGTIDLVLGQLFSLIFG